MISLRRLQHLLFLVEYGHFGHAAKALNISQPALTKSIQALEAELGLTLLDRARGAPTLTAFGELVVQRCKPLFAAEDDLQRELALLAGHEAGSLKVALGPYPSITSGYPAIARMLSRHPKIRVAVSVVAWREVPHLVASRAVDIGIADLRGLQNNELFDTELIGQHVGRFCCRSGHPLTKRKHVTLSQLMEFPWLSVRFPPAMAAKLPKPLGAAGTIDPVSGDFVPNIEIDAPVRLATLLPNCDAIGMSILSILKPDLDAGKLALIQINGLEIKSNYGFITQRGRTLTPATIAFMDEVRDIEKGIVKNELEIAAELGVQ